MDHHHAHGHHDQHNAHRHHELSADQHRFLDLDAEVFAESLPAVLDRAGLRQASGVVDLGAGSGVGSRLLRARFPDATVTCVDNDPRMLQSLHDQGFAVVTADLDDGYPVPAGSPVDLVWASSSLHHVDHPARLLSGIRRALTPDGVLVVVELAGLPRFLVDPVDAQLEQRCHDAAAAEGWNHHPEWAPVIEAAGFAVTRSAVATDAPATSAAREYALRWFTRFAQLTGLSSGDRDEVAVLIRRISADLELQPRCVRTVWVATPTP